MKRLTFIRPRGSALLELPFAVAVVALLLLYLARFADIGLRAARNVMTADAATKREWIR